MLGLRVHYQKKLSNNPNKDWHPRIFYKHLHIRSFTKFFSEDFKELFKSQSVALDGYVVAPMRMPTIKEDMKKYVYWQERYQIRLSIFLHSTNHTHTHSSTCMSNHQPTHPLVEVEKSALETLTLILPNSVMTLHKHQIACWASTILWLSSNHHPTR